MNSKIDTSEYTPEDRWAMAFFDSLFDGSLSTIDFEEAVIERWKSGRMILSAPGVTELLISRIQPLIHNNELAYPCDDPAIEFQSHWVVGQPGKPGAIFIKAPAEKNVKPGMSKLNRPMHMHDSGRINLVTSGKAIFYFTGRNRRGQSIIVDCRVSKGDLIFWPAWTPHTFNSLSGFSVISSMPSYVSPEEDGYTFSLGGDRREIEAAPHMSLPKYLALDCATSNFLD